MVGTYILGGSSNSVTTFKITERTPSLTLPRVKGGRIIPILLKFSALIGRKTFIYEFLHDITITIAIYNYNYNVNVFSIAVLGQLSLD